MNTTRITLNPADTIATIHPNIYGHFAEHLGRCIYDGIWVGEDSSIPNIDGFRTDIIEALRRIKPSIIRWPGGCFADDYHWQDGVGPRDQRPRRINIHWGEVIETNQVGTQEFIRFCRLVGAAAVVSAVWVPANVLSSPRANWTPWPTWTAGVLHDVGIAVRDHELYDRRTRVHEILEDVN